MNPGDKEAEKKFKEASEAYAVLSDAENADSMISSDMPRLNRAAEVPEDSAALISTAAIWEISLVIFSEIFSEAVARDVQTMDR